MAVDSGLIIVGLIPVVTFFILTKRFRSIFSYTMFLIFCSYFLFYFKSMMPSFRFISFSWSLCFSTWSTSGVIFCSKTTQKTLNADDIIQKTLSLWQGDFVETNFSLAQPCVLSLFLGAVHILRNTFWGGGGLPDLLQYYIGGGLLNSLQYYRGWVFKIYYNITVLKGKWKVVILFQL